MESGTISHDREQLTDLANDLWDILYFDVERFIGSGGTVVAVEDTPDIMPLEEQGACALRIYTDDLSKLKRAKPLFDRINSVFLFITSESKRSALSEAITSYYPKVRQFIPLQQAFGSFSSLRDLIDTGGNKSLDNLFIASKEKPSVGLLNISDIHAPKQRIAISSGIRELDRTIGGFYGGELSIWTGERGSGKSTMASEVLLESIEQGKRVCAYSGELAAWRFKQWILLQAAGPRWVYSQINPTIGNEYYTVRKEAVHKIEEWWNGKLYLYDNEISSANDEDSILSIFDLAYSRYGCTVFLCDNLMTVRYGTSKDKDFYRAQSNYTGRLVEFAKRNNVHVHMVAHPRKLNSQNGRPTADDVGGSGDITNRADNVFGMSKLNDDEREKEGFDTALEVLKNRAFGKTAKIKMKFDDKCRRFYKSGESSGRMFSWEKGMNATSNGKKDLEQEGF